MDINIGRYFQDLPSIPAYAETCTGNLRAELPKNGINIDGLTLQLEPGRVIFGDAGIHLTTVRSIKTMKDLIKFKMLVVDTTEFRLTGGRYEHNLHEISFCQQGGCANRG